MDRTETHTRCQSSDSEQLVVNAKLFSVIRKRNISTKEKVEKIKKLLGKTPQPDINVQDGNDNWNTALHLATKRNELEVVNFLLSQGADTAIENGDGKMPLQLSEECNNVEIIDMLKSCTSLVEQPHTETNRLASHISQPVAVNPSEVSVFHSNSYAAVAGKQTTSTLLMPFSGKLRVDTELKLSHSDFKQSIEKFYANKHLSPTDQLKATPYYPTPHMLAQFASMAYHDCKHGDPKPPNGWKLLTTASHFGIKNGYFGTAYWHPEHQQVVIVHRSTDIKSVGVSVADVKGVLLSNCFDQMSSASTFANKVVAVLQEIEQEKTVSFELFFTGHSLGGWLAQITTFTTEYLEDNGGMFLKKMQRKYLDPLASSTVQDSHDGREGWLAFTTKYLKDIAGIPLEKQKTKEHEPLAKNIVQDSHVRHSYHPHTVVFDSPGCKYMLSQMADEFDVRLHGSSIDLQHLDITIYLSAPNCINTCNSHLGTVYRIFTDLSDMGRKEKHAALYNLATYSMDKIVKVFDPETGQVHKDDKGELKIREVVDWPVSAFLRGDAKLNSFFKWAEQLNNYHPEVMDTFYSKVPKGYPLLHYQTKAYDECTKSLSVFTQDEREFLECYRWLRDLKDFFKPGDLFSVMNNSEDKKEARQKLQDFKLENECVRCPDARTLHNLIPYVKQLVRLFPQMKDKVKNQLSSTQIRNRVYQYETQHYVEMIHQSALDFKSVTMGLREFLDGGQQIWQIRMIDGDAWTGIAKVYRVLQNTSCMHNYASEGHYTILETERLLTVNRMINFNALMASMETPHLLMIACGTNQRVNDELENMFKELFNILKQKNNKKIILTTQSESYIAAFIKQIARETHHKGFITTDEQLNWSDLTASSQRKMLEKTVIFQGRSVTLNQLTSAESMTDSFALVDLLQEKDLRIGEELATSASSGYNERYYIDRTFSQNIVIRQDISNAERQGKFTDLLATTELEFKQLCQENPKSNVHWLEKDKSGELIWQQSQGNLQTLRKYIDTQISHCYAPSDLENLLQQAKNQRVMLIADKAGMGKSTVLTHLSKRIKQKYPAHWMVRTDLNEYGELFKAQKGKKMDKGRVLEFVSKEVLKLESNLEKLLFKKCFEGNGISKVVIMVDGFDEICPEYKETVSDMLQVLKRTSLEQLWVTTRPHLREDLEDNLQQLSYNLQPFSEDEQVEFLKKFWLHTSDIEVKNQHRLQIYAKALIRKLAQSVSDKDKEFTGIPLQTRLLADAFKEEFRSFYLSEKSEPQLLHKLNLVDLYRWFIERKYGIYYREKSKIPEGNMAAEWVQERDFKYIQLEHQLLALEALFAEDLVTFLKNYHYSTFSDEQLVRIGLAQRNQEGKLQFIHRTFADYFVAEFLVNQLTKKTKQHVQLKELLLNEVLLRKDCHVIRAFLNGLLENSKPSTEALKEYGDHLDEQWKKAVVQGPLLGATTALHKAATEDNARILGFLLDSLKSGENSNALKVMLLAKDCDGRTAWHMTTERGDVELLEKLWDCAKKLQLKAEDLRNEMLLSKDKSGQTTWHIAASRGHVELLQKMWNCAKELQLKPDELRDEVLLSKDKYGRTAWHIAASRGYVELLQKMWDCIKELQLKPEELRNEVFWSKEKSGQTAWHMAARSGKVKVLEKLWDWAKILQLKPEWLRKEVLMSKDKSGQTACLMAARSGNVKLLERLWGWAKALQPKPEELNEMWLSKDKFGQTAWHMAAGGGHVKLLEKLWDWAKEGHMKPVELRNEVWLSKDNSGQTPWHKAALRGKIEVLEKLWSWAKKLQLKPEELRDGMFFLKDTSGKTAWHMAAGRGKVDILEKLWDWAKELQLEPEELRDGVCLLKDRYGKTAWHMAAGKGNVEVLEKLWDWAKELQLKPEELRDDVCLLKDSYGKTAWHIAEGRAMLKY